MSTMSGAEPRFIVLQVSLCREANKPIVAEGVWRGTILRARRGEGGFGYDPIFRDPASGLTGAELTHDEKNARSHRGQALRGLVALLQQQFS